MKTHVRIASIIARIAVLAILIGFPVIADETAGGGNGFFAPPNILTGDAYLDEQGECIIEGKASGDIQTLLVEIDGDSSTAVPVNAAGEYTIVYDDYYEFAGYVDLIAIDTYGISELFTVDLP